MYQGTTPALNCAVFGWDLTNTTVYVTVQCGWNKITKSDREVIVTYVDDDPESDQPYSSVIVLLSQEETLSMRESEAVVQMRFIDSEGMAYATTKANFSINDVIYRAVIQHKGGEEP